MNYIAAASTDIGSSRHSNQDALCVKIAERDGLHTLMAVVCDGMGGLAEGERASATVICALNDWFETEAMSFADKGDINGMGKSALAVVEKARNRILEYSAKSKAGMGTTMSCLLAIENKCIILHVGDSRVYLIEKGTVHQLTTDHTVVAREVAAGRMTPEEALHSPQRNKLTQCVGSFKMYEAQVRNGKLAKNSVFLLCSDGFRHHVSEAELTEYFAPEKLETEADMINAARLVTEMVMSRGEKDNISVAIVKTV